MCPQYWEEIIFSELMIKCPGRPGHGSQFIPNTAGEKLHRIINHFLSYRDAQKQKLMDNPELKLGDVTTINLTVLEVRNDKKKNFQKCSISLYEWY